MERLLNAIRVQAGTLDRTFGQPRFATVTSFDSSSFTARVQLQPEGVITGWLPVLSPWTGAGWGMVCPLLAGDQVLVLPQEGDAGHGVIVGRAFSELAPPPVTPTGEVWLSHPSGSRLCLRNDGTVYIAGDLHVGGEVYDVHGSLGHLRQHYNSHTHVGSLGARTSNPDNLD